MRLIGVNRWLAVTLLVGVALRVWGLHWGLPDLFEEATPFFRAWAMWNWADHSGVSFDPGFYRYPSLVFYAHWLVQAVHVSLAWISGGAEGVANVPADFLADRTEILYAARAVGAAFGVALIAATFALGRRVAGPSVGLVAAAAVAVNGYLVEHSQLIEVDLPGACLATWAVWACVVVAQDGTRRSYATAGILLGLAASAKYPGAFVLIALIAAHAIRLRSAAREGTPARAPWLGLGIAGVGALAAFAATSPFVLIHLDRAWADVAAEREHMRIGHFGVEEGRAYADYARSLFARILGPIGTVALLGGIVLAAARRSSSALVVALFAVGHLAVVGSWTMRADRYLANVVPSLWVLASFGLVAPLGSRRWPVVAGGALLLLSSGWTLPQTYERTRTDTRTLARKWIESHVPAGALFLMEAWGPDLFKPEDLWVDLSLDGRRRTLERTKRPLYGVQFLPTNQTAPEASEAFYDLSLFDDVDVIVLSSDVGDRYRREPDRFPGQLAFYREVNRTFARVAEFDSTAGPGPRIEVFARPHVATTFSRREEQSGPRRLRFGARRTAESEGAWFRQLGLNYETFGFEDEALEAYAAALDPPDVPSAVAVRVGMGMARVHLRRDDRASARAALLEASRRASRPEDRAMLIRMAEEVPASP